MQSPDRVLYLPPDGSTRRPRLGWLQIELFPEATI